MALRDVAALSLIAFAIYKKKITLTQTTTVLLFIWSVIVTVWGGLQTIYSGNNPILFLIGLRFWLLYYWFGFASSHSLTSRDFHQSVKFLLTALIVMAPLAVIQHYAPIGALINRQVDTEEDQIFVLAKGVVRATGTFSFTLGYTAFLALCLPFVFYILDSKIGKTRNYIVKALIFSCICVATIVSGSRTAVIYFACLFAAYILISVFFSSFKKKVSAAVLVGVMLSAILALSYAFQDSILLTQERFENASLTEDITSRITSLFVGGTDEIDRSTLLGAGIGTATNFAGYFVSGKRVFLLAETEPGRILAEGGALGFLFLFAKVAVSIFILVIAISYSRKFRTPHPVITWIGFMVAFMTWPASGQLTANALIGIYLGLALIVIRESSAFQGVTHVK